MSEKLTTIHIPGTPNGWGLMDWGEKTVPEMIALYRSYAVEWRKRVEAIEACADGDFAIAIIRGVHVQHPIRTLQEGRPT